MRIGRAAEATTVAHPPLLAVRLIRLVARALGRELGLQPLERQHQPVDARAKDRIRALPAMLLELAAGVLQPPAPAATRVGDVAALELELRRRAALGLIVLNLSA
jgi:hypothetical protein